MLLDFQNACTLYEVHTVASGNFVTNTNSAPLWLATPPHKTLVAHRDFPTGFFVSQTLWMAYTELLFCVWVMLHYIQWVWRACRLGIKWMGHTPGHSPPS